VDPGTRGYSKTKYVASFAGFAPINDPQLAVVVILDSAVGLHQGGQVSAPVFQRVMQQSLEYLHVPHDVQFPPSEQTLMASRNVPESSLEESSPDRLGATLDLADAGSSPPPPPPAAQPKPSPIGQAVVPAALLTRERGESAKTSTASPAADQQIKSATTASSASSPQKVPSGGTVVLDVEEGGIEVPSFLGKNLRIAIEAAQDAGLDLDAIGSGVAREQVPLPGTRVTAGSRITVHFGR
jgi:cell division protein FtsI (penicillin-binding protein 3)